LLIELRFHGRGGMGVVTAAELLVNAALREGFYGQSIPMFGPERRGAPVVVFARVSDRPIRLHSRVEHPNIVVVFDHRLANFIDVTKGFKGDLFLINAPSLSELPKDLKAFRLASVDATEIAVKLKLVVAGWPVVNTAMLGALAKASGLVSLNSVVSAIKERWPGRIGELNAEAARRAYQEVLVEVAS